MTVVLAIAIVLAAQSPALGVDGTATWYAATDDAAAAGPGLRQALGRGWRGTWVRVSHGGRSVVVQLSDWCRCRDDRVIDLNDGAFSRLAPLSQGIVRVTVVPLHPPATDAR